MNRAQHLLLQYDIQSGIRELEKQQQQEGNHDHDKNVFWWQGASIWEDGSTERGFIVAFQKQVNNSGNGSDSDSGNCIGKNVEEEEKLKRRMQKAHDFIIQLAAKYNQGAVYRFEFEFERENDSSDVRRGRLVRETVPVLDAGTEACLEVEIDDEATIDLSLFE